MLSPNHSEQLAPREVLLEDHVRLLQLFDEVLCRLRQNDREETRSAWRLFDSAITAHLEAEEKFLFPAYRAVNLLEVEALERDHAKFRKRLDEMGIAVDLHTIRADAAQQLVEELTEHSRREDVRMYLWAETHLSIEVRHGLHARLQAASRVTSAPEQLQVVTRR